MGISGLEKRSEMGDAWAEKEWARACETA